MLRIIIERHLKENKQEDLMPLLRELRTAALHQPGYITGEALVSVEDSTIVSTLSTWRSLEEWKVWEKSESRIKLHQKIEPLLIEKPKVSIYQVMATEEKAT